MMKNLSKSNQGGVFHKEFVKLRMTLRTTYMKCQIGCPKFFLIFPIYSIKLLHKIYFVLKMVVIIRMLIYIYTV